MIVATAAAMDNQPYLAREVCSEAICAIQIKSMS
jgi:hypothetical protein